MKRAPHFLPPLQSVVYGYTRRMLDETATNANSFAMDVADRYLATVAPDVRTVPFKLGEGDALLSAMKANGQTLRRYMDGTVKSCATWGQALADGRVSPCEERRIVDESDDVIAAVLALRRHMASRRQSQGNTHA